jgi:hypothetical protein
MDYLRGGEGRSRAKSVVGGVGEAHGRGVGKAVEVDGVLRGWRRRRAPGEAVEATACSGGEAVKGTLRRRRRASDVGGVKYLKRTSGENLLSVEWVTHAPDIYIGGQMRDTRSLRHVTHYF